RQGQADRLLNDGPAKRFEFLRELVPLKAYRRLHDSVEARRKQQEQHERLLRDELASIPEVTDETMAAARIAVDVARTAAASARETVERLTRITEQARRWEAVRTRLETISEAKALDRQLLD